MATERTPMYCVKCGQATYDAKYCDKCRCVFCPNSDKDCECSPCKKIIYRSAISGDIYCNRQQLPGQRVCPGHFCTVCLTSYEYTGKSYLFGCCGGRRCSKFRYFIYGLVCRSCRKIKHRISPNFNCIKCECMYCDNIHCIEHTCLLCDKRIWFNDPDLKYCQSHACKQCLYEPVANGRFCAECSVNRTVGAQTKRAN